MAVSSTPSTSSRHGPRLGASAFLLGNLFMIFDELIFGMNYPVQKLLIPHWMSAVGVSSTRILGATVLFWLASLFIGRGKRQKIARSDWWVLVVGGAVCVFGFMWFYALALQYASVISVSLVMTCQPVLIILINALFFRFRISRLEVVGVVIALVGAVLVALVDGHGSHGHADPHASHPVLGDLFAFACSLCYAAYICLTRKISLKYHPVVINRWLFLFAAVPALFFIGDIVKAPVWHAATAAPYLEVAFVVVMASFVAYFLVPPAIKSIGDDLVGIYGYTLPVFAAVISILMGVDHLRWQQPLLFAMIIFGVVLITLAKRKMRRQGRLLRNE